MLRIANKHGFSLKVNSLPLSGKEGLAAKYKTAKGLTGKKKTAAYTALGLTVGGAAVADENIENQINTFGTAQAANGAQATGFTTGEKLAGAGAATGAYKFRKPIIKAAGKSLGALAGPVPIAATYPIFGFDPKSSLDRTFLGAELAAAPSLVKTATSVTDKIKTPALRKAAELLTTINPKYAMRAARIASPIGIASLGLEGLYQGGKFAKKRMAELKAMYPEERAELGRKSDEFAFSEFAAAGGGIAKLAGDRSGAMLESMNPNSQGLRSLYNNGKKL